MKAALLGEEGSKSAGSRSSLVVLTASETLVGAWATWRAARARRPVTCSSSSAASRFLAILATTMNTAMPTATEKPVARPVQRPPQRGSVCAPASADDDDEMERVSPLATVSDGAMEADAKERPDAARVLDQLLLEPRREATDFLLAKEVSNEKLKLIFLPTCLKLNILTERSLTRSALARSATTASLTSAAEARASAL